MPLDYSKWDRLALTVSSDEEDNHGVNVTSFDNPKSIIIPGKNDNAPKDTIFVADEEKDGQKEFVDLRNLPDEDPKKMPKRKISDPELKEKQKRAKMTLPKLRKEWTWYGGETELYYWCQDRHYVTIRFKIPKEKSEAKHWTFEYEEASRQVTIKYRGEVFFSKPYPKEGQVQIPEDKDWGWMIEDDPFLAETTGGRVFKLEMNKREPTVGLVLWWSSAFKDDPETDLTVVKERNLDPTSNIWEEAHKLYKERVKNFERIPVHIPDDKNMEGQKNRNE